MKSFNEHESVIYTDADGRMIDTFVIFDTNKETGLTHINYMDLKVDAGSLQLRPGSIAKYNLPMQDAFSFEIYKNLKEKYANMPALNTKPALKAEPGYKLAKAS